MNCLTHGLALILLLVFPGALSAQGLKPVQSRTGESAEDLLDQINKALGEPQPISASKETVAPATGAPFTTPATPRPIDPARPRVNTRAASGRLDYLGLVPGQSTKVDVELLLGDPIETGSDVSVYRPPNEATDATRIEARYFKESRVLQSLDVFLRSPLLRVEITAHAGRRILSEKDGGNWVWEFYMPSFLALGSFGDADGAAMSVDRLRYVAPQIVADIFLRRGLKAESENRTDDALTEYEKASRIDSKYAIPYLRLGGIYQRSGAKDKALLHYTAATEAAYPIRSKAEGHFRAGRLHDRDRQYEIALKAFNRSIAQDPSYPEAYFGLGRIHHLQERFEPAMSAYKKALELKPDYVVAHDNLGSLYERGNHLKAAAQSYEKALQYDPKRSATWHRLVRVRLRMSEFTEAENTARRRLAQEPDDTTAMVQLAMALSSQVPERAALLALFQEDPQLKDALDWLDKAISRGYRDRRELESSTYLRRVREQESRSFNNLAGRLP